MGFARNVDLNHPKNYFLLKIETLVLEIDASNNLLMSQPTQVELSSDNLNAYRFFNFSRLFYS